MPLRHLEAERFKGNTSLAPDANADWKGNNAAFTCPVCSKVFIVTHFNDRDENGRRCPGCNKSTAYCTGSPVNDGEAWIEWDPE